MVDVKFVKEIKLPIYAAVVVEIIEWMWIRIDSRVMHVQEI